MSEIRRREIQQNFQKEVHRRLLGSRFPPNIFTTVEGRIRDLFHPYDTSGIELLRAAVILRSLRKHDAHRVLKTWVNSWATSTRFHSDVRLPCLFGCPGHEDRLSHYCMCPNLYGIVRLLCTTSACPLERLGLVNPSKESLLTVACVFSAYHAVKRSALVSNMSQQESLHEAQTLSVFSVFADTFRVEANEVGLSCRCLTHNSFLSLFPNLSNPNASPMNS